MDDGGGDEYGADGGVCVVSPHVDLDTEYFVYIQERVYALKEDLGFGFSEDVHKVMEGIANRDDIKMPTNTFQQFASEMRLPERYVHKHASLLQYAKYLIHFSPDILKHFLGRIPWISMCFA